MSIIFNRIKMKKIDIKLLEIICTNWPIGKCFSNCLNLQMKIKIVTSLNTNNYQTCINFHCHLTLTYPVHTAAANSLQPDYSAPLCLPSNVFIFGVQYWFPLGNKGVWFPWSDASADCFLYMKNKKSLSSLELQMN